MTAALFLQHCSIFYILFESTIMDKLHTPYGGKPVPTANMTSPCAFQMTRESLLIAFSMLLSMGGS